MGEKYTILLGVFLLCVCKWRQQQTLCLKQKPWRRKLHPSIDKYKTRKIEEKSHQKPYVENIATKHVNGITVVANAAPKCEMKN